MTAERLRPFGLLASLVVVATLCHTCGDTSPQPAADRKEQPTEVPSLRQDEAKAGNHPEPELPAQEDIGPDNTPKEEEREARIGEQKPGPETVEKSKRPGYKPVKQLLEWEEEERNRKYSEEELARFRDIADGFQMFELADEDTVLRDVVSNYPSKWAKEDMETCCRPMAAEMLFKIERSRWPSIEEAERLNVAYEDIPEDELRKTWYWIKVYLREEWVRPGVKGQLAGLRSYLRDSDFLIARYEVDGCRIHIVDSKEIVIAIQPAEPRGDSESIEDFVLRVAEEFLTPIENLEIAKYGPTEYDLLGLWSGTAMYGPPGDDMKAKRFFDWLTNGRAVAFFMIKRINPITGGFFFEYVGGRSITPEAAAEEKRRPHKKFP